jgi:Tfp pilus assembly protein PilF
MTDDLALREPTDEDLLRNAVQEPVRQMIAVEIGGPTHGALLVRQLREWAGPQRAVVDIAFNAHTDEPGEIWRRCRDATPDWKTLEPPGLLILRDTTPPDVTPPASVARKEGITPHTVLFWRGANLLRENWDDLSTQLVFLITPQQYTLSLTEADHLRSWFSLKLHPQAPPEATPTARRSSGERDFASSSLSFSDWDDLEDKESAARNAQILQGQLDEAFQRHESMAQRLTRYYLPLLAAYVTLGDCQRAANYNNLIRENESLLRPADRLRWLRLRARLEEGQNHAAQAVATAGERLTLAQSQKDRWETKEAFLQLALLHKRLGHDTETAAVYESAIAFDPQESVFLGNYANFLQNVSSDYERAEEYYQSAIEADPQNAISLGNYALFLKNVRGDYERAEEYYQRAIEADPKRANNLGNYALFLQNVRGDYERAEEYYQRAIEADPQHANTLGNYALFLQNVRGDYERAEEYYQRAIEADPQRANNLGNYALFLQNVRGDYERAEEYYQRAIEANPQHANTLGNYAQLLFAQGRHNDAKALLKRAEAKPDSHPTLQPELAFYRYAHLWNESSGVLAKLKALLQNGARSPGWNLELNIKRSEQDGHPNVPLLKALAEVISDKAPLATLDEFEDWRLA